MKIKKIIPLIALFLFTQAKASLTGTYIITTYSDNGGSRTDFATVNSVGEITFYDNDPAFDNTAGNLIGWGQIFNRNIFYGFYPRQPYNEISWGHVKKNPNGWKASWISYLDTTNSPFYSGFLKAKKIR